MGIKGSRSTDRAVFRYSWHVLNVPNVSRRLLIRFFTFHGPSVLPSFEAKRPTSPDGSQKNQWVGLFFKGVDEAFVAGLRDRFPSESKKKGDDRSVIEVESKSRSTSRAGNLYVLVALFINRSDNPEDYKVADNDLSSQGLGEVDESWYAFGSFHFLLQSLEEIKCPSIEFIRGLLTGLWTDSANDCSDSRPPALSTRVSTQSDTKSSSGNGHENNLLTDASTGEVASESSSSSTSDGLRAVWNVIPNSGDPLLVVVRIFTSCGGCVPPSIGWKKLTDSDQKRAMYFVQGTSLYKLHSALMRLDGLTEPPLPDWEKAPCNYFAFFYCDLTRREKPDAYSLPPECQLHSLAGEIVSRIFITTAGELQEVLNSFCSSDLKFLLPLEILRNRNDPDSASIAIDAFDEKLSEGHPAIDAPLPPFEIYVQVLAYGATEIENSSKGTVEAKQSDGVVIMHFHGISCTALLKAHATMVSAAGSEKNPLMLLNDSISGSLTSDDCKSSASELEVSVVCHRASVSDPTAYRVEELQLVDRAFPFWWDMMCSYEQVKALARVLAPENSKEIMTTLTSAAGRSLSTSCVVS